MFFAINVFVLNHIDVVSAILEAALKLAVPSVVDVFA